MKRKAESLFKRLIEYTKNENKGSVVPQTLQPDGSSDDKLQTVEPVRALKIKGKTIGSRVPEVIEEIAKRIAEILGTSLGIETELSVKVREFYRQHVSKDMIKIINESNYGFDESSKFGGVPNNDTQDV